MGPTNIEEGTPDTRLDNWPKYAEQPGTHKAPPQAMQELGKTLDPPQITAYIKAQERKAAASMRGYHPGSALRTFCASMQKVISTSECEVNYIHISTIITALGRIWPAAQRNPRFKQTDQAQAHHVAEALYHQSLKQLQPMMQDIGAQAISNIMLSSAKIDFNPDVHVPGMAPALADRFLQLMHVTDGRQRPTSQAAANLIWAFATMRHAAATAELLDSVCKYFAGLMHVPDVRKRPNAQDVANVMWALAGSRHSLKDGGVLLDDFSMYMYSLLQCPDQQARPAAQGVAITMWALAQMKHVPPREVVSAILDHFVGLCQTRGLQPTPQGISNVFIACAELRLSMRQDQVELLLKHLLGLPVSQVDYQHYCNVAWSLAVMGFLDNDMFDPVLDKLVTKHNQLVAVHGSLGTLERLPKEMVQQLHQALEWCKPPPGSQQNMEAWSTLSSRLQVVAPEPRNKALYFPGQAELYNALADHSLRYKSRVPCGLYWADAVLSSQDNAAPRVLLVLDRPEDYSNNLPSRVLGPVAFRTKMLSRHGTVVTVPCKQGSSSVESMVGAIKTAVEANTGLPLDSFRS